MTIPPEDLKPLGHILEASGWGLSLAVTASAGRKHQTFLNMEAYMAIDHSQIAKFCQKHHITRMLTYVHPSHSPEVRGRVMNFLVDFEPGYTPGYFVMPNHPSRQPFGLLDMEEELAGLVGEDFAFITDFAGIGRYFRSKAVDDARAAAVLLYPVEKTE